MCIFYVFGLLFGSGALFNAVRGDWPNVAWGTGIAVVLLWIGSRLGREEAVAEEFEAWLLEHKTAIFDGETLDFHGQPISLQTQLTRYRFLISFLVASLAPPTRYLERGAVKTRLAGLFCSFLTLILGWWSLPTGPLETIAVVFKNARGGEKTEVARLINELAKAQSKTESDEQAKQIKTAQKVARREAKEREKAAQREGSRLQPPP